MRVVPSLMIVIVLASSLSCASTSGTSSPGAAKSAAGAGSKSQAGGASAEKNGVVAPSAFTAVSIWPEVYGGSALVLDVLPHGSMVKEGDVIAHLDTRPIDEQIHEAELEAHSAGIRHQGTIERNKIEEESARWNLEKQKAGLDRARRSLEGWKKKELEFSKRSDEIEKKWEEASIDDQKDELDQLEKMYKADELVDATEDIVLKRARRRLGITATSNDLSRDRSKYHVEHEEAMQTEQREENVREQEGGLDRLVRSQEIERRAREDAAARSADALELQMKKLERVRRDRELLALHAPRAGVLLHGKPDDYRPGATPPRYERGSQLSMRADLFVIADPEPGAVAVEVTDAELARLKDGSSVAVKLVESGDAELHGTLRVEPYPRKSAGAENVHTAVVTLEKAMSGVLYGTRAMVTPSAASSGEAAKAGG